MKSNFTPALLAVLAATALFAQTEKGTIRGTVTDSTGAVAPGAVIIVTEIATNIDRKITSDANGNYEVPDLQQGMYRVKAESRGGVLGATPERNGSLTAGVSSEP